MIMQDNILAKLKERCNEIVKDFYDGGHGLKGTELKNYTSGDGLNIGFEGCVQEVISLIVRELGLEDRVVVNGDYFNPPCDMKEECDPQRLDFHIWKDDKAVLLIETRAWVDKPFYTLKRAVVRNFMELDYVRERLRADAEFVFLALALDIKDRLVSTMDKTMGYGDRITEIKLSPYRRGYQKKNYFDFGHVQESVDKLVELLYNKLNQDEKEISIAA